MIDRLRIVLTYVDINPLDLITCTNLTTLILICIKIKNMYMQTCGMINHIMGSYY